MTSKKHDDFANGPMGEKSVKKLAGIGRALGDKLEKLNIDKFSETGLFIIKFNGGHLKGFGLMRPATDRTGYTIYQDQDMQAYMVLGLFLVMEKDKETFIDWIKDAIDANSHQARECYTCLKKWCDMFL